LLFEIEEERDDLRLIGQPLADSVRKAGQPSIDLGCRERSAWRFRS